MYDNNEAPYFKRIGTLRRCFLAASSIDAWRDEFKCRIHQFTRLSLPSFPSIGWRERERREHSLVLVRKSIFQSWYWRCARLWLVKHSLRHIVLLHRWVFFSSLSPISISLSSHTLAIYIFILNTWRIYALTSQSIGAAPCSVSPHSITIDVHVRQKINGCGFGASTFFPTLCFVFCRTMKPSNKKMCTTEAYVPHSLSVYIDVADEHVAKPFATQPTVCVCVLAGTLLLLSFTFLCVIYQQQQQF